MEPMTTKRAKDHYAVCHVRCRTSQNVSPFAPCRCRCGGYAHGADTLRGMGDVARAKVARQMRDDVRRGASMIAERLLLGAIKAYQRDLDVRVSALVSPKRRRA